LSFLRGGKLNKCKTRRRTSLTKHIKKKEEEKKGKQRNNKKTKESELIE